MQMSHMHYLPLTPGFFSILIGILGIVFLLLQLGVLRYAYLSLGVSSGTALLLLVGSASPAYMAAYRTGVGTVVAAAGGLAIFVCYLAMRHLGRIPEPGRSRGRR